MKIKKNIGRKTLFILLGTLIGSYGFSQILNKHEWENRVLIVFSSDGSSPNYIKQLAEFSNSVTEMKERKLVLYQVINEKYAFRNFTSDSKIPSWKSIDNLGLKKNTKKKEFSIALIGLDGEVKLQKYDILPKEELFRIIDSMPMRMNELRRKND